MKYEVMHTNIINGALFFLKKNDAIKFNLEDLAEYLGISKKTLYNHFKDKDDLILNVFLYDLKIITEEFLKINEQANNPIESIYFLLSNFYITIKERQNIIININHIQDIYDTRHKNIILKFDKFVRQTLLKYVIDSQNNGLIHSKYNPNIITHLFISNIKAAFHNNFKDPIYNIPTKEFFDTSFCIIFSGILTEEGYKIISKIQNTTNDFFIK